MSCSYSSPASEEEEKGIKVIAIDQRFERKTTTQQLDGNMPLKKMTHCIGVRNKGEGGGASLTFVNISNMNIGDNIENNIGDNVGDIGVLREVCR